MLFNQHSDLRDKHAFLSASKYHWINYNAEKILSTFDNHLAAKRGVELHAFAHDAIRLGVKLPNNSQTINMYVNDCIGYRMVNEQVLVYSHNAFGTADAINFSENTLRIFDLKTGVTPASMTQLKVYASFFCLEYNVKPSSIEYDLRIYQNDAILYEDVSPDEIVYIMDRIVEFDKLIEDSKKELV